MRQRPTPKTASKATTAVVGLDAPVEVRRHPKARRMTLRVSRTKRAVIVTMPSRCNVEDAGVFVNRHLAWVRDRLDTLPEPIPFCHGLSLPLRGLCHRVCFTDSRDEGRLVSVRPSCDATTETAILVHGRKSHAARHLSKWLILEARSDLERQVAIHARTLGVKAAKIAVRDQSSRWGSCSTTRVLSFSWRLVLAPPAVLDYVAAHEVAHLAEMNHGPRFWALVDGLVCDMNQSRRWLSVYGSELHRYGQPPV